MVTKILLVMTGRARTKKNIMGEEEEEEEEEEPTTTTTEASSPTREEGGGGSSSEAFALKMLVDSRNAGAVLGVFGVVSFRSRAFFEEIGKFS